MADVHVNDTAGLQAAINKASVAGGTIHLAAGAYGPIQGPTFSIGQILVGTGGGALSVSPAGFGLRGSGPFSTLLTVSGSSPNRVASGAVPLPGSDPLEVAPRHTCWSTSIRTPCLACSKNRLDARNRIMKLPRCRIRAKERASMGTALAAMEQRWRTPLD